LSGLPTPSLTVVLVRPQNASNLGSVARAAKNFAVSRITIVEPGVAVDDDSRRLAAGADDVLAGVVRCASLAEAIAGHQAVVAPLWDQSKDWGDEQWRAARDGIRAVDAKDRSARGA